jgi:hypothetical protein
MATVDLAWLRGNFGKIYWAKNIEFYWIRKFDFSQSLKLIKKTRNLCEISWVNINSVGKIVKKDCAWIKHKWITGQKRYAKMISM